MTFEEWKKLPFKTNGKGEWLTNGDCLYDFPRRIRRKAERLVKKGENPKLQDVI